jgi:heavy metal translocating P-type ATPase
MDRPVFLRHPLPFTAAAVIVAGAALRLHPPTADAAHTVWLVGLVLTGAPVVWQTVRGMFRGRFAADLVATLAIVTAVLLTEPLAGLIVVLMQTGGEALERYAERRASDAVRALEEAAPRIAHRLTAGRVVDITVDEIAVGDLLLVRPGELLPCDGVVIDGRSHVDASALTGEPIPVRATAGTPLLSGSINGESPITVRAQRIAGESQYARIVELVRTAQASKSPIQRLADRYAVWFTPVTLIVCVLAYLFSGDPLRVLAVLVVATPCPLIIATPVAIIGGINRAAKRQIIVRSGGALERLGRIDVAVLDKTGTLTYGLPSLADIQTADGYSPDSVLRLAASIEQGSSHLLARTLVEAAFLSSSELPVPRNIVEAAGGGVYGEVDGHDVAIGSRTFILGRYPALEDALDRMGGNGPGLRAFVAIDGAAAGVVHWEDRIRPGLPQLFAELHRLGVRRIIMLSGDHEENARAVAEQLGIDEVRGDLLPQDKVAVVQALMKEGLRVVMVGDGTNDAPALGTATVGIALAGHGGGITTEAADIVLLVDDPGRVAEAIRIGRRSLSIARQSINVGLGLSATAMVVAAFGYIPPTIGALLQEAIDIAVILNALRASAGD